MRLCDPRSESRERDKDWICPAIDAHVAGVEAVGEVLWQARREDRLGGRGRRRSRPGESGRSVPRCRAPARRRAGRRREAARRCPG